MATDGTTPRRSPAVEALFRRLGYDVVAVATTFDGLDPSVPPLDPAEAAAVQRAQPGRRREFAVGRGCAHAAVAALRVDDGPIVAGDGRAPVWPAGVVGSITHTAEYCLAVVAHRPDAPLGPSIGLGVDAETVGRVTPDVAEVAFTEAERSRIATAPDPGLAATIAFAAKEAFYKAQFAATRDWVDFDAVRVDVDLEVVDGVGAVALQPGDAHAVLERWRWPVTGAWCTVSGCDEPVAVVGVVTRPAGALDD